MTAMAEGDVSVGIPPGYLPLPLQDSEQRLAETRSYLLDAAGREQRELIDGVVQAAEVLLGDLSVTGTRYAGFGLHTVSEDSTRRVTSILSVSVLEFPDPSEPRALLQFLQSDQSGSVEIHTLESGRPVLFREQIRALPAPQLGGANVVSADIAPVYQFAALVPSLDGRALASIEVSTPSVEDGPTFMPMIAQMAIATSFAGESAPDPTG